MTTIYIVERASGEYEDRREVQVKAFHSQEKAKELVDNAQRRCGEIAALKEKLDDWEKWWQMVQRPKPPKKILNEFDPYCSAEETHDQKYYLYSLELE